MIKNNSGFNAFFWTQFSGAFNDNFFKNALVVLITYRGIQISNLSTEQIVALSGGIFILPFFLFSPIAGQLADKFEKSKIVRLTKLAEILIMLLAAIGFLFDFYGALLFVLFLMGAQSTFFGPVKYSALPELLNEKELTTGNAYVEAGTFIAILLGTICGGWFTTFSQAPIAISIGVVAIAGIGYLLSRAVPHIKTGDPNLKLQFNPLPQLKQLYQLLKKNRVVGDAVFGISWFWFFGAGILSVLPIYVKQFLNGDESVITLFLAMFTLGIGLGSFLCDRLSEKKVELGLVPVGSLGMTIFLLDFCFLKPTWSLSPNESLSLTTLIQYPLAWRMMVDFFMTSVFGGLFILPLYTVIQQRTELKTRSRVIAANNIANAIFMVVSSILILILYAFDFTIVHILFLLALLNVVVATIMYLKVPEFTLRFYTWILSHLFYRVRVFGKEHIPSGGACILAANHVTYLDWLFIAGACPRPARFVMWVKFFDIPIVKTLLRQAKVIPIASSNENPKLLDSAFDRISHEIQSDHVICMFPEGRLSTTGKLAPFKPGLLQVIKSTPCPVVPIYVHGLWGSLFSKSVDKKWSWRRTVNIYVLPPLAAESLTIKKLEEVLSQAEKNCC